MFQDHFINFISQIASIDRLNISIISLLFLAFFGYIVGALGGNATPFLWGILDRIFGSFSRKTYKVERSASSLHFRGGLLLSLYIVTAALMAAGAGMLLKVAPLSGFMEPLLLSFALCGGAVWKALIKLHHAIRAEQKKSKREQLPKGSYFDIAVSTRTNLNTTDQHGIIRGGIGFVASSFDKGVIAPLFWYLLGGLPACYLYAGIAAARWAIAKEGFAKGIGGVILRLEYLAGILPQCLTTLLLALSALMTPSARCTRVIAGLFRKSGHAPYAEGGMPLTALAYGLGVSLGGPVEDIDGSVLKRAWVGSSSSTAKVEIHHLRLAIYWSIMAYILTIALLLGGVVLWRLQSFSL